MQGAHKKQVPLVVPVLPLSFLRLDMNVSEHTGDSDEDAAAFYGYEEHIPSPNPPPKFTLQRERPSMMPGMPNAPLQSEEFVRFENIPPMSPDRAARKQRSISRRGGACYASLLQSAVQATMSSLEIESAEESDAAVPNFQESRSSPRKRVRRSGQRDDNDAAIAQTSSLFGGLQVQAEEKIDDQDAPESVASIDRKAPVRRVSRRTSYDSRATADSDLDSLDLDD